MEVSLVVEKKTQGEEFFQVSIAKQTFSAYTSGEIVSIVKDGKRRRIHDLPLMVLFGDEVVLNGLQPFDENRIGLYLAPVRSGWVHVQFKVKKYRNLKTIKFKASSDLSWWPIKITYASVFHSLSKEEGRLLYFTLDWEDYKKNLIAFKAKYQHAKYFVYREGVDEVEERASTFTTPKSVRAKDVLESDPESNLKLDPVFMARVYLRAFNWVEFRRIPLTLYLTPKQVSEIYSFTETMRHKIPTISSLQLHEAEILTSSNYFQNLKHLLSYNSTMLEKVFDSKTITNKNLILIFEALKAQRKLIEGQNLIKEEDYLSTAIEALNLYKESL